MAIIVKIIGEGSVPTVAKSQIQQHCGDHRIHLKPISNAVTGAVSNGLTGTIPATSIKK